MSGYRFDVGQGSDIRFKDIDDKDSQEWAGYPGYKVNYRNSNFSQEQKRMIQSHPENQAPTQSRNLQRGIISAISNVSGVSDDGYKSRYLKALKELNNVLEANKKVKEENQQLKRQLNQMTKIRDDPKNQLIQMELDELRIINQKLEQKISQILQMNKEYEDESNNQRDNFRKQADKARQLNWKIQQKQQQINSLKDRHSRQIENLNDTINQLQNANMAFKSQQFNLKQMYGGKEEANVKKINYLETQLQQAKSQLTRQRQKVNNEIQQISIRIRKQTQNQLITYKLQMTKLKDINIEYQREIEKLNKELKETTVRKVEKKNSEQRHINQLQQNVQNCKKQIKRLKQTLTNTHSIEIQKQSLQKQVKILQNNLFSLTQESTQSKAKINSLQLNNDQLSSTNHKLQIQIKRLRNQIQKIQSESKRKQTIITRYKNQSDTLKNKVIKLELDHSKHQNVGTRANFNDLQDRIRQLKSKVNFISIGGNVFQEERQEKQKQKIEAINNIASALEEKMEIIVNQNAQLNKRLQHYKQKCAVLQKKVDSTASQMKILSTKVEKYEVFVPKLQNQLEKAIKQTQYVQQTNTSQYLNPSQNLLKDKLRQMNDRLILQSKYAKQQLETKCLQYDSKLVSSKLQINKLKQALKGESFFHNRITQLSQKLADSENKKLELMIKVGDLERFKILTERISPGNIQKDQSLKSINQNKNISSRQIQDLKESLQEKDKQITRLKGSVTTGFRGYYNQYNRRGNQNQLEIQQLNQRVSQLVNQNNILIRSKQQVEHKNFQFQNIINTLQQQLQHQQQQTLSHNNTLNFQIHESNDISYDEISKLRQQNTLLRQFQKNYFQLEQKSSIIIKTFQEVKTKYDQTIEENIKLQQQNESYKKRQIEYQTQVDSMQKMFDIIHRRLEEALYQNTELVTQINKLKGITALPNQQGFLPSIGLYGKMMSQEEQRNIFIEQEHHYESSPEVEVKLQSQHKDYQKDYQKEFEKEFFGGKKDSDNSYEYETDFKGDGGFGEYY